MVQLTIDSYPIDRLIYYVVVVDSFVSGATVCVSTVRLSPLITNSVARIMYKHSVNPFIECQFNVFYYHCEAFLFGLLSFHLNLESWKFSPFSSSSPPWFTFITERHSIHKSSREPSFISNWLFLKWEIVLMNKLSSVYSVHNFPTTSSVTCVMHNQVNELAHFLSPSNHDYNSECYFNV